MHTEKPLAVSLKDAEKILALARKKGLRVGAAPDTFLGAGIQTCVRLIDEGAIGIPVAATAFMTCHGHESWHPDPAFYYAQGGGPVFDMGPYYFTALIALLGPARRVSGSVAAGLSAPGRRLGAEAGRGASTWRSPRTRRAPSTSSAARSPRSSCPSTSGTRAPAHRDLRQRRLPERPGPQHLRRPGARPRAARTRNGGRCRCTLPLRGELARAGALRDGRGRSGQDAPHRASGALGLHALEIMHAVHDASSSDRAVNLRFPTARPEPLESTARMEVPVVQQPQEHPASG